MAHLPEAPGFDPTDPTLAPIPPSAEVFCYGLEVGRAELPKRGEDTMLQDEQNRIFGVFDGAGGAGGVPVAASQAASRGVHEVLVAAPAPMSGQEALDSMRQAFRRGRDLVRTEGQGGTTTATVAWFVELGGKPYRVIGNAGDSRAFSSDVLTNNSRELAEEQTAENWWKRENPGIPFPPELIRNVANAFSDSADDMFDGRQDEFHIEEVRQGEVTMLCSDSITGDTPKERFSTQEMAHCFAAGSPQAVAEAFLEVSLEKKSDDKSVLVIGEPAESYMISTDDFDEHAFVAGDRFMLYDIDNSDGRSDVSDIVERARNDVAQLVRSGMSEPDAIKRVANDAQRRIALSDYAEDLRVSSEAIVVSAVQPEEQTPTSTAREAANENGHDTYRIAYTRGSRRDRRSRPKVVEPDQPQPPSTQLDDPKPSGRAKAVAAAFRAAYGLQGVTLAEAVQEMSVDEIKKATEVPAFVVDKAKTAYQAGAARLAKHEGWDEFMDLPAEEQAKRLEEKQPSFLESWKAKLFPKSEEAASASSNPEAKSLQAKAKALLGVLAVGQLKLGAEWALRQPGQAVAAANKYFQDAEKGTDRQTKAAILALGVVAVGVIAYALNQHGIDTPNVDASGVSPDNLPDVTTAPDVSSTPEATTTAPSSEAAAPSRPAAEPMPSDSGVDGSSEVMPPTTPEIQPEATLEAYNSATGAGTVEGTALQNFQELGIDTGDLNPTQLESFTNQLRTETLQLNGWSETRALSLQQGDVMRLLHQEQIEAILGSVRSN